MQCPLSSVHPAPTTLKLLLLLLLLAGVLEVVEVRLERLRNVSHGIGGAALAAGCRVGNVPDLM